MEKRRNARYDPAWKIALTRFFKDFVELCWPEILDFIDWSKKPEFLAEELLSIDAESAIDRRFADKVVKVWHVDGHEIWALVHLEVQLGQQKDFSERIFQYRYRLYDKHQKDVATLAILIDNNPSWRPNVFEQNFWGSTLRLEYPILKVLDYKRKIQQLEQSDNPFAWVLLAQLLAMEDTKGHEQKLLDKFSLARILYTKKLDREAAIDLLRFLKEIVVLEQKEEAQFDSKIKKLEQKMNLKYLTSFEEEWREQALREGVAQGELRGEHKTLVSTLNKFLVKKFGQIPSGMDEKLQVAGNVQLQQWLDALFEAEKIEDVFKH